MEELMEKLHIVTYVINPVGDNKCHDFAVYGMVNAEGYSWSVGLDVEPRETLLERGRYKFKSAYPNLTKEVA